ncbi:MAG: hypothetical protein U0V04_12910 [Spirosomataceae bacterium]|jgi:hypothetical protein
MNTRIYLFLFQILIFSQIGFSQKTDTTKAKIQLKSSSAILLSTNGVSPFPNILYGKPTINLALSIGKKGLFFEPDLRWGLNGKPWMYVYWLRYKLKKSEKFGINIGVHTAYNIKPCSCIIEGKDENRYIARRNIAYEFVPSIYISDRLLFSFQYLQTKGLDKNYGTQMSRFLSFQPKFPKISLSKSLFIAYFPQLYHLKIDNSKGFYFSQMLSLNRKNFPINVSSVLTKTIKSTIPGNSFNWNASIQIKLQ